ncbi:MAG: HAD family hydrolase [Kiritimatiellae bacterium]|nr:HAD family hydrolase [Kiritimatiellia bacterium]
MNERDYTPVTPLPGEVRLLPGTSIEIISSGSSWKRTQHALFDFDGTLSLIREGWVDIMIPMLVDYLMPWAAGGETSESITVLVRDFVTELTGKQTIYQMMRLADEIRRRGGEPLDPLEYKADYHERLMKRITSRREALLAGSIPPDEMLVPGSFEILRELRDRGVTIYIASGTDENYVIEEARMLGLVEYANGGIYGAQVARGAFSKEMVIRRIIKDNDVDGTALAAFGDGYVEIADCKAVGGLAVAVASDEAGCSGICDSWKRERLIGAGADIVIPDFRESAALLDYIWDRA